MVTGKLEETRRVENDKSPRHRVFLSWLVLIAGVILSVGAYFLVRDWEKSIARTDFEMISATHAAAVNLELMRHLNASDVLAGLYDASQRVERQEFHQFAMRILAEHDDIQGLMWAPRTGAAERSALEQQAAREGLTNFRIRDGKNESTSETVDSQADSFPVFYLEPMDRNGDLLGVDFMADPEYRGTLESARDTGRVAVSGPIQLNKMIGGSSGYGVLLAQAVYGKNLKLETPEERRAGLAGFVLQLFRVGDLIEESLRETAVLGLDVAAVYERKPNEPQQIYFHPSFSRKDKNPETESAPRNFTGDSSGWQLRVPLDSLGNSWMLIFTPAPKFWANHLIWESWAVLAAGSFATLMLGMYLLRSSAKSIQS